MSETGVHKWKDPRRQMRFVKHACLDDYRLHHVLRLRSRFFSVSVLLKNYCCWNYVWNKHQSWRKV